MAGVLEETIRVFKLNMFAKSDAVMPPPTQQLLKRSLAILNWLSPQIVPIELQQIEGEHEHAGVVFALSQSLEHRQAASVTRHCLAVYQK